MIRRDVLTSRREIGDQGDGAKKNSARSNIGKGGGGTDMRIELESTDHEEPTWEVRSPGDTRRRRTTGRTRSVLLAAAVAAIVVNAGAAWIYWRVTEPGTGRDGAGTPVELVLRARNDLNQPLKRGGDGNLTVTVINDYDFPVRITTVVPGAGNIVADDEHRDAGCTFAAVNLTQPRFEVRWDVPRNTVGAFTVPDALAMRANANKACVGAVFTIPVKVSGESRETS